MSGKLIIQGKAWGEFESAKRSKGNIEISGYRSYGGTHTVRMVDQPRLNDNQQIVLDYLKEIAKEGVSPMLGMEFLKYELGQNEYSGFRASAVGEAFYEFNNKEEAQVLQAFSQWALEQEEE